MLVLFFDESETLGSLFEVPLPPVLVLLSITVSVLVYRFFASLRMTGRFVLEMPGQAGHDEKEAGHDVIHLLLRNSRQT